MRTVTQNPAHPQKQASPALARSNMATHKPNQRGNPLPQLQRTLGNQAMQRMLQTHDEEPNAGLTAAVSPRVGHDFSQILKHPPAPEAIQTKLAISKPGDKYEQEADRVADQVMRMPEPQPQRTAANGKQDEENEEGLVQRKASEPLLQRKCACGSNASALTGKCEECGMKRMLGLQTKLTISEPGDRYEQEADRVADQVMRMPEPQLQRAVATSKQDEEDAEDNGLVQRKTANVAPASSLSDPNHFLRNLGPGQPLDAGTRSFFEPRFGHDLSHVRVHAGHRATESAESIQAKAYTLGRDVVFGAGQFAPATTHGQRLLAHELTHVIQQQDVNATQYPPSKEKVRFLPASVSPQTTVFRRPEEDSSQYRDAIVNVRWSKDWVKVWRRLTKVLSASKAFNVPRSAIIVPLNSETKLFHRKFVDRHINDQTLKENKTIKLRVTAFYTKGNMLSNVRILSEDNREIIIPSEGCGPECYDQEGNVLPDDQLPETCGRVCVDQQNLVHFTEEVSGEEEMHAEEIEQKIGRVVCGPDITDALASVLWRVRNFKPLWGCHYITSIPYAINSWDINQLQGDGTGSITWLALSECSGFNECQFTVQIEDKCYYISAANYVVFGAMMRRCGHPRVMLLPMIGVYKTLLGSDHTEAAILWAKAGYDGWPYGGAAPIVNNQWATCKLCGAKYSGPRFTFNWKPDVIKG